ncbi:MULTISPECIES: hypothetical protein [Streptomyces]|uniref:LPXTG cell wall anchor domain-containing protein n=1 Tax=Streptomyces luteosporeus TaxID=173856 RepID=A0ABN3TKW9_9ACTN
MSKFPRRRNALRAAVASAALASAVLAPATAAFAMDPGASTPTVPATKPAEPTAPTAPTASTAPTTGTQPSAKASAPAQNGKETGKASPSTAPKESKPADDKNGDTQANELGTWRFVVQMRDGSSGNVYQLSRGAYNLLITGKGHHVVIKAGGPSVVTRQVGTMLVTFDTTTGEVSQSLTTSSQGQGAGTPAHQDTKGGAARFEGTVVSIGKGLVAVLRYDPANGSAEAWIRNVGPDWKPGDPYIQHVAALLNRDNVSATVEGLNLSLEGVDGPHPVLLVNGKSYDFPAKAKAKTAAGATGVKANGGTTGVVSAAAQTKVMPQGGVAAGAEGVREGNDTALLAAGGALASVSAAGVAFAVLRRRADRTAA